LETSGFWEMFSLSSLNCIKCFALTIKTTELLIYLKIILQRHIIRAIEWLYCYKDLTGLHYKVSEFHIFGHMNIINCIKWHIFSQIWASVFSFTSRVWAQHSPILCCMCHLNVSNMIIKKTHANIKYIYFSGYYYICQTLWIILQSLTDFSWVMHFSVQWLIGIRDDVMIICANKMNIE